MIIGTFYITLRSYIQSEYIRILYLSYTFQGHIE